MKALLCSVLLFALPALADDEVPAGVPIVPQGAPLTKLVAVQLFLQRNPAPTIRATLGSDTLLRFPAGRQVVKCGVGNTFISLTDAFGRNLVSPGKGSSAGASGEAAKTSSGEKLLVDVNLHIAPPSNGSGDFPGAWFNCKFSNGDVFTFNVLITTVNPYAQVYFREGAGCNSTPIWNRC